MKIVRILAAAALLTFGLGLAGCDQGEGGPVTVTAAPAGAATVGGAPTVAPTVDDPAREWCGKLSALGTKGTPDEYRTIATALVNAPHVTLAAAALRLHDATGTDTNPVDTNYERGKMIEAVLDLAEECLRATG